MKLMAYTMACIYNYSMHRPKHNSKFRLYTFLQFSTQIITIVYFNNEIKFTPNFSISLGIANVIVTYMIMLTSKILHQKFQNASMSPQAKLRRNHW